MTQTQSQYRYRDTTKDNNGGAFPHYDCARCDTGIGVVKTLGAEAMLCEECAVARLLGPNGTPQMNAPADVTLQIAAPDLARLLVIAYEEGKIAGMPPDLDAPDAPSPAPTAMPSPPSTQRQPPRANPPRQSDRPAHPPAPSPQAQPQNQAPAPAPASAAPGVKACKACRQPIQPHYTYCYNHRPPLCGQCGVNKLSWSTQRGEWFEVCYTCRPARRAAA